MPRTDERLTKATEKSEAAAGGRLTVMNLREERGTRTTGEEEKVRSPKDAAKVSSGP